MHKVGEVLKFTDELKDPRFLLVREYEWITPQLAWMKTCKLVPNPNYRRTL